MKVLTNILKVKDEDQVQVIAEEEEDMYTLFNIIAKGEDKFWTRIGAAFVNRDGSLNVVLNTIPLDGKLHIRDPKPPKSGDNGYRRDRD